MAKANGAAKKRAAEQKAQNKPTMEQLEAQNAILQQTVAKLIRLNQELTATADESKYRLRRIVDEHNEAVNATKKGQQQPAQ